MKVTQHSWSPGDATLAVDVTANWVLAFGSRELLPQAFPYLRSTYPSAQIVTGTTSGDILDTEVSDDRVTVTGVSFETTRITAASADIADAGDSYATGSQLASELQAEDLAHVFVLSDGQRVNGSELARGFNETLPEGTILTGGLAGDGTLFECTLVGLNAAPSDGRVVAVGFYGKQLEVGFGCAGGWSPFGPVRTVTRSEANILHELDSQFALDLYKRYLGKHASKLPGSALRFPLALLQDDGRTIVRTILSVDEDAQTMTFAGDVPEGSKVRFMRASYEDLVDGAAEAATGANRGLSGQAELAILVSCVGRRIVLGQRTEEETEAVREVIGAPAVLTGFYSYGELAPAEHAHLCELHNQTMTITTMREAA